MFGLHQYDDIVYHKYNLAQPTILTPMQLKVFCLHYISHITSFGKKFTVALFIDRLPLLTVMSNTKSFSYQLFLHFHQDIFHTQLHRIH